MLTASKPVPLTIPLHHLLSYLIMNQTKRTHRVPEKHLRAVHRRLAVIWQRGVGLTPPRGKKVYVGVGLGRCAVEWKWKCVSNPRAQKRSAPQRWNEVPRLKKSSKSSNFPWQVSGADARALKAKWILCKMGKRKTRPINVRFLDISDTSWRRNLFAGAAVSSGGNTVAWLEWKWRWPLCVWARR